MPALIAKPEYVPLLEQAVQIHAQWTGTARDNSYKIVRSQNIAAHFLISDGSRSIAVILFDIVQECAERDPLSLLSDTLQELETLGKTFGSGRAICLITFKISNPFPILSRLHFEVWKMEASKRPKLVENPRWVKQGEAIAGLLCNLVRRQEVTAECAAYTEALLRSDHITQPILTALVSQAEKVDESEADKEI